MKRTYAYLKASGLTAVIKGEKRVIYDALCDELSDKAPSPQEFMNNIWVKSCRGDQLIDKLNQQYGVSLDKDMVNVDFDGYTAQSDAPEEIPTPPVTKRIPPSRGIASIPRKQPFLNRSES